MPNPLYPYDPTIWGLPKNWQPTPGQEQPWDMTPDQIAQQQRDIATRDANTTPGYSAGGIPMPGGGFSRIGEVKGRTPLNAHGYWQDSGSAAVGIRWVPDPGFDTSGNPLPPEWYIPMPVGGPGGPLRQPGTTPSPNPAPVTPPATSGGITAIRLGPPISQADMSSWLTSKGWKQGTTPTDGSYQTTSSYGQNWYMPMSQWQNQSPYKDLSIWGPNRNQTVSQLQTPSPVTSPPNPQPAAVTPPVNQLNFGPLVTSPGVATNPIQPGLNMGGAGASGSFKLPDLLKQTQQRWGFGAPRRK